MGKKVDYRTNAKERKIFKIVLIIISIILISYILIRSIINAYKSLPKNIDDKKVSHFNVDEYGSLDELLNNYNCSYIRTSKDGDITKIYVMFDRNLYTDNKSNEDHFFKIARVVADFENYIDFELIDNSRDIDIVVLCENNSIVQYTINGDNNYYLNHDSEINAKKKSVKITDFSIESKELISLINNNWSDSNIDFGSRESTCNGYNIYFDEGIKYKKVSRQVFNLIFTQNYNDKVVSGLYTTSTYEDVESILGVPTYQYGKDLYGYLGENNYLFFDFVNKQISIYPIVDLSNETKFIEIINKMNKNSNIKEFATNLTDLWRDYDIYDYNSNYVNLQYTLYGVSLNISSNSLKNGIYIYQNYSGDRSIKDLENVYIADTDLVVEEEYKRSVGESIIGDGEDGGNTSSSKFRLIGRTALGEGESGIKGPTFYSLDKEYPDSELDRGLVISSYFWYDDFNVIYSVDNEGIYVYNCAFRQNTKLADINENININSVQNNKIIYNETEELKITIN